MNYKVLVAAALATTVVRAAGTIEDVPPGWFKNGQGDAFVSCAAGVDAEVASQGLQNLTIKCDTLKAGFAGIMQSFGAQAYRGKRLRYSASIKTTDVSGEGNPGGGVLWMRVDEPGGKVVAFDNMLNRSVKGTTEWARYQVVLDVSQAAEGVALGTFLQGRGQLWISDIKLDVVGTEVPVTDIIKGGTPPLPSGPANLTLAPKQ